MKSLRLFELSGFESDLRRGGDGIPLLPPFVELPVIGSLLRWPTKPQTVHHRSFAIVSAIVLPTSADLATTVSPSEDIQLSQVTLELSSPTQASAIASASSTWEYVLQARRQNGDMLQARVTVTAPAAGGVELRWTAVGNDARYTLYRRQPSGGWMVIRRELTGAHYTDDGGAAGPGTPPTAPTGTVSAYVRISPISFLAGNVNEFHGRMLQCIADEAYPVLISGACSNLSLSDMTGPR